MLNQKGLHSLGAYKRAVLYFGVWLLAACLYAWMFDFLHTWMGGGTTALSFVLVLLAAWLFGLWGGIVSGPLTILLNLFLMARFGLSDWRSMWQEGGAMGSVILLLTGIAAGKISDLNQKLRLQLIRSLEMERDMAHQAAVNRSLADLAAALIAQHSLEEIAALVLEHVKNLTHSSVGYIAYLNPNSMGFESLKLDWPACQNNLSDVQNLLERLHLLNRSFWQQRSPMVFHAFDLSPVADEPIPCRIQVQCLMAVPAFVQDKLVGLIVVADPAIPYSSRNQELAQELAALYAIAIQKHQVEQKYRYMSLHDELTGLYNRASFEDELRNLERSGHFPIGVIMIDLDGLKTINDTLGHSAGDVLLQRAANVLRSVFRSQDMIARIGGDEFAILLPGLNHQALRQIVERVHRRQVEHNVSYPGFELKFSLGAAVALTPQELWSALTEADAAMYEEKSIHSHRRAIPG